MAIIEMGYKKKKKKKTSYKPKKENEIKLSSYLVKDKEWILDLSTDILGLEQPMRITIQDGVSSIQSLQEGALY